MLIYELSQEELLLQQADQKVKVANNLNEFSNYSTPPQPQQINPLPPLIIYGPQQIDHNNIPPFHMPITCTSELFKDQNFETQKQEFIKILKWLFIGSGIEFFLTLFCLAGFQFWNRYKDISPWIFGSCLILFITLSILSQLKLFKDLSLVIYVWINVLLGIIAASFCGLFDDQRPPQYRGRFYLTTFDVVIFIILTSIFINSIVQLLKKPRFIIIVFTLSILATLLLITIFTVCSMYIFPLIIVPGLIALFYDMMLLDVLNRALHGHFQLKINQLFVNVNSIVIRILIPCFK